MARNLPADKQQSSLPYPLFTALHFQYPTIIQGIEQLARHYEQQTSGAYLPILSGAIILS
jgi:hypothetical protein